MYRAAWLQVFIVMSKSSSAVSSRMSLSVVSSKLLCQKVNVSSVPPKETVSVIFDARSANDLRMIARVASSSGDSGFLQRVHALCELVELIGDRLVRVLSLEERWLRHILGRVQIRRQLWRILGRRLIEFGRGDGSVGHSLFCDIVALHE